VPSRSDAPAPRRRLAEYDRKRDFTATPEPRAAARTKASPKKSRDSIFVVQKHAASRLHYDFRLELDGVLKSWAVPKGPSLDPKERRLAMHVEDHPREYASFKGVIPPGEYGAGKVEIWDRGTWAPVGDPHAGYRKGNLKFTLRGRRLRGNWVLVRMRDKEGRGEPWLLIKERDDAAEPGHAIPENGAASGGRRKRIGRTRGTAAASAGTSGTRAQGGAPARSGALPRFAPPQLATLVDQAPEGDEWLHEIKFDGYRILGRLDQGRVRLLSRNDKDWTSRFSTIAAAVARLPARSALLDGEVAVLRPDGTTSFQALQQRLGGDEAAGDLVYMVFDLLHLDGRDLRGAPLEERKAALESLLARAKPAGGPVRYSAHVVGGGGAFLRRACGLGLEGAVSKRRAAPYTSGRSLAWLKAKCLKRQEVVIGGYTEPEGARVGLGALLVGVQDGAKLHYAGKVGTGFSDADLHALTSRLERLRRRDSPFAATPRFPRVHWVEPELVGEVAFTEWTSEGRMRHPSFQGLREDKPARAVVRERAAAPLPRATARAADGPPRAAAVAAPDILAGVKLTHPDRVLYPEIGLTKRDLARYYESVAEWMLPHLADRPTTLLRCPDGVGAKCFFQRHARPGSSHAIRRVRITMEADRGEFLIADSRPALIELVQMGVLEIHTWNAVARKLERPDRAVFDLDPGPGVRWPQMLDAARLIRRTLQSVKLESFVKTTGGKGLHVVVPLAPASWDKVSGFTRTVATEIARSEPDRFTATMAKVARTGRIFIDYLRNTRGATSVSAFSTRATAEAPVSVPLGWDELAPDLPSDHYTVKTVPKRLGALRADPWARYWTLKQTLP
jgi:bifunctional non-homologous end joining protein LigD